MRQKIFNASLASWLCFLALLLVTLTYGLVFRDKAQNTGHGDEIASTPVLSAPLAITQTNKQQGIYQINKIHTDNNLQDDNASLSVEVKREAVLMGSQFVFIVDAPKQQALAAITQAADAIKQLEIKLSSWKPNSDISRLNEFAGINSVVVAKETFDLLQLAKTLSQETQGTFDITVGAVWDIWPFRNRQQPLPSAADITQALRLVDAQAIELDIESYSAFLPKKGMKVNLGAIGKGYAAGVAIKKMQAMGIERAAVSAGGDIYLLGEKNSGPWVVELEHPRWPGRYLDRFVAGDLAVATSGDAKQYIEKNGQRYSHILDPRTGWPVDACQSVTIVTKSATKADAYATAVYVLGPEKGLHWVEQQAGVEALIVDKVGRVHRSSGWQALTRKSVANITASNKKTKASMGK